jgi:hypothetical protein
MSAPETKSFCIGTFKISVYAAFAVFLNKQAFQKKKKNHRDPTPAHNLAAPFCAGAKSLVIVPAKSAGAGGKDERKDWVPFEGVSMARSRLDFFYFDLA